MSYRERRAARKAATQVEEEATSSPAISPSPSRDNTPPTSPSPKKEEPKPESNNNVPRRKYGALEPNRGKTIARDYVTDLEKITFVLCKMHTSMQTRFKRNLTRSLFNLTVV